MKSLQIKLKAVLPFSILHGISVITLARGTAGETSRPVRSAKLSKNCFTFATKSNQQGIKESAF